MNDETKLIVGGRDPDAHYGMVNPPICRASTLLFPSLDQFEAHRPLRSIHYGRCGLPTSFALEDALADIEGADTVVLSSSGKTVIGQALLSFLEAGDHLLMVDAVYSPTRAFCDKVLSRFGVETTYYDPMIGAGIDALFRPETKIVFCESPGSLTFEVQDVSGIAEVAHQRGALVFLDNTWATSLYFKPFDHGVDISLMSATKYIAGHADLMMGVVSCREPYVTKLREGMRDFGAYASPDDCFAALRGLRTMALRLARHQATALTLARWLQTRPEVDRVLHPALPGCPGHDLWRRDFSGSSGLFGVVLRPCSREAVAAFVDNLEMFGLGYSWGGHESLVLVGYPEKARTATQWRTTGPVLRLHAGLEHPDDLIADLDAGFRRFAAC
jgi:cystathionine beta-lyase